MKTILNILDHIEEIILFIMMAVLATVVFIQVIFRVTGGSLTWSEEMSRYLAVWVTFIGTSLGIKRGAHVGVEALKTVLPKKIRIIVELIGWLFCIGFCLIIIVYGIQIVQNQMLRGQVSPSMRIPIWWAYVSIPIGMSLSLIRIIQVMISEVRDFISSDATKEEGGNA